MIIAGRSFVVAATDYLGYCPVSKREDTMLVLKIAVAISLCYGAGSLLYVMGTGDGLIGFVDLNRRRSEDAKRLRRHIRAATHGLYAMLGSAIVTEGIALFVQNITWSVWYAIVAVIYVGSLALLRYVFTGLRTPELHSGTGVMWACLMGNVTFIAVTGAALGNI